MCIQTALTGLSGSPRREEGEPEIGRDVRGVDMSKQIVAMYCLEFFLKNQEAGGTFIHQRGSQGTFT